jgi:F0F1-type ATP synthase membrane subunit b/b'
MCLRQTQQRQRQRQASVSRLGSSMTLLVRRVYPQNRLGLDSSVRVLKEVDRSGLTLAASVIEAAEAEANRIVSAAHEEATELRLEAERKAVGETARARADLAKEFAKATVTYATGIKDDWVAFRSRFEAEAVALVKVALLKLLDEAPAEAKLRSCLRALFDDVGSVETGVLHVHPDDAASVSGSLATLPWPMKIDADIALGSLCLIADQGQWRCSVRVGADRVLALFDSIQPAEEI